MAKKVRFKPYVVLDWFDFGRGLMGNVSTAYRIKII